ncbi:hypothetical protein DL766_004609 [Monosporascus sp. MC13-8B]|uniref:Uncharacterized protein n=1 Tax=Monosporascus cannonballus TaxID=155416 RepID=A0ABY0HBC6_9PEZI|nr:hypothetical protein DL763_006231 [Monosporascus cannonballus]RYO89548.1 hypothetical protein DL762_003161 [Monosporascus cannonballus]RYP30995.1 hypothetical protein DL766_004609 [Monosporascus sp. MC13-8B]
MPDKDNSKKVHMQDRTPGKLAQMQGNTPGEKVSSTQDKKPEQKEQKDLNPARRPQRLYLRRERAAMPKAMNMLRTSAWLLLDEDRKNKMVDAVRNELNTVLNRDMDNYPRGAQIDYETLVRDAVCKVFWENLSLFKFEDEDEPLVCELFDLDRQYCAGL